MAKKKTNWAGLLVFFASLSASFGKAAVEKKIECQVFFNRPLQKPSDGDWKAFLQGTPLPFELQPLEEIALSPFRVLPFVDRIYFSVKVKNYTSKRSPLLAVYYRLVKIWGPFREKSSSLKNLEIEESDISTFKIGHLDSGQTMEKVFYQLMVQSEIDRDEDFKQWPWAFELQLILVEKDASIVLDKVEARLPVYRQLRLESEKKYASCVRWKLNPKGAKETMGVETCDR